MTRLARGLALVLGVTGCPSSATRPPPGSAGAPAAESPSTRAAWRAGGRSPEPPAPIEEAIGTPAGPSTGAAVPETPVPSPEMERTRELLEQVIDGPVAQAWTTPDGLFLLVRTAGPATRYRDVVRVPPAAREAAAAGRVLAMADVWRVETGRLERVWRRPVGVQPMVCEVDECAIVSTEARMTEEGLLDLRGAGCEQALADLRAPWRDGSTYDVFDRTVVPLICAGRGRFIWRGRTFVTTGTAAAAAPRVTPPVSGGEPEGWSGTAALPPQTAAPPRPTFLSPEEVPSMVLGRYFDGAGSSELVQIWRASTWEPLLALVVHSVPAAHSSYVPHTKKTAGWASGRAVLVAEIWAAKPGSFQRVLQLPIGLTGLGEPLVVLAVAVEVAGDEARVGDPRAPCAPDSSLASPEPQGAALDRALARRICASRGRYQFEGNAYRRIDSPAR